MLLWGCWLIFFPFRLNDYWVLHISNLCFLLYTFTPSSFEVNEASHWRLRFVHGPRSFHLLIIFGGGPDDCTHVWDIVIIILVVVIGYNLIILSYPGPQRFQGRWILLDLSFDWLMTRPHRSQIFIINIFVLFLLGVLVFSNLLTWPHRI